MFNETLPIASFRDVIVGSVREHPVTIVVAETGAGKSTQVPQVLLAEGYNLVVTQPRRLAARTVAARVAEEFGSPLGDVVGFRTAYERQDSEATRCLFVTDGLALVRELMGAGNHGVLVIDEVHEWNLNIEVLVAWAKRQIDAGSPFKVVLMSATLEADRLSAYFGGAPIVNVPGRTFPVAEQTPAGSELEDDVAALLQRGRNVLVFQPGKREIGETIAELTRRAVLGLLNAEILPLHGELTPEEQARCFRTYGRAKVVVATNVAQTSVTIADIDAVVDAGTERRIELVDGIEGLYLKAISLADREQRKGRAGRTKPGVYIDWCPTTYRLEFPLAEILRVRLDQTVLRLAEAGIDAEELRFFHQPDVAEIHEAKRALVALGCMDANGVVTRVGRRVAKLPISVKYGRMIVEAERLGVVDDLVTVAAIMEQGGIVARVCPTHKREGNRECRCWQRLAAGETGSDMVAQLLAYKACGSMTREEMREGGIFVKAFYQAKEKRRHLADALRGKVKEFSSGGRREDILKAICAGMVDHLYRSEGGNYYRNGGGSRELGRESVVVSARWLVGEPWDLQIQTRRGPRVLALVKMASAVDPTWLAEVAPQLVDTKLRDYRYSPERELVVVDEVTIFNGQETEAAVVEARICAEATAALAWALVSGRTGHPAEAHNAEVRATLNDLYLRSDGRVQPLSDQQLQAFYVERIGESKSLAEIAGLELELALDDYAPAALREEIDQACPKTIAVDGLELNVAYQRGYAPKVTLPSQFVDTGVWKTLSDEDIVLPDGRMVSLEVTFESWDRHIYANVSELKAGVREYLNRQQWSVWRTRPEITLPVVTEESAEIPPITEAAYGADALTGETLLGFGTTVVNQSRYYITDPYFRGEWFRVQADAIAARDRAVAAIDEIRAAVVAQRHLVTVKARAEAVRVQVVGLYNEFYSDLGYDLRDRLYYGQSVPSYGGAEAVEAWIVKAEALAAEAEAAVATIRRSRQEAAERLLAARDRAEELRAQAQRLLDEHGEDLGDEENDQLNRISGDFLPTSIERLEEWTSRATAIIAKVEDILKRPAGGWHSEDEAADAIAALAAKFGKH